MWLAHVGDSRAVLCEGGQAVRLTEDHTPELPGESERVAKVTSYSISRSCHPESEARGIGGDTEHIIQMFTNG